jgi:TetR/AcrR family transcriptional regulator, regulator of cefoperazone and chloramphenicol sensitivity
MAVLEATKSRLLEAAGEEFAEKGFDAARIRSICRRAGANVAAVNYHFGDKEQLYVAAVLEAHRCGTEMPPVAALQQGTPAEQLRRFIHFFLSNVVAMNRQKNRWHHTLMLREMLQPTAASEVLVREAIRPRFERLKQILRQACPEADELRLDALGFSVVGQCLHYKMAAAIIERVIGPEAYRALDLDYLTDHISGFCLAALGLAPPLNEAGVSAIDDGLVADGK